MTYHSRISAYWKKINDMSVFKLQFFVGVCQCYQTDRNSIIIYGQFCLSNSRRQINFMLIIKSSKRQNQNSFIISMLSNLPDQILSGSLSTQINQGTASVATRQYFTHMAPHKVNLCSNLCPRSGNYMQYAGDFMTIRMCDVKRDRTFHSINAKDRQRGKSPSVLCEWVLWFLPNDDCIRFTTP